jgi:hypothetical protein
MSEHCLTETGPRPSHADLVQRSKPAHNAGSSRTTRVGHVVTALRRRALQQLVGGFDVVRSAARAHGGGGAPTGHGAEGSDSLR